MVNPTPSAAPGPAKPPAAVGSPHLSVRPDDAGPVEVLFLFEQQEKRIGGAVGLSMLSHAAVVALIVLIGYLMPDRVTEFVMPERNQDIVYLLQDGPGGGGGGGGNEMPDPPAQVELVGEEAITVPAEPPEEAFEVEQEPETEVEPPPIEIRIPAVTMAAAETITPGVITSSQASASLGLGTGGGADTGRGVGIGPGDGDGLGPGRDGGTGGGIRQLGSGIEPPVEVRQVRPAYTAEAMRAKVQGIAVVECVVRPDGSVTDARVVRSLDSAYGLDEEAVKAALQWRFEPARVRATGEAVAVLIRIELTFALR